MKATLLSVVLLPLSAVTLVPSARSQTAVGPDLVVGPTSLGDDIALPSSVIGPIRGLQAGHIASRQDVDAMFIAGTTLHLAAGLGRFASVTDVLTGVRAAALLPTGPIGIAELPDLVLASTNDSFERLLFRGEAGVFLHLPSITGLPGLVGADHMAIGDLDGSELDDLWTATNGSVRGWSFGLDAVPQLVYAFETPDDALELASVDWDGDGLDEVAVLSASGLRVHAGDGTLLQAFVPGGLAGATMEVLRGSATQAGDRIALAVQPGPLDPWRLDLISSAGRSEQGLLLADQQSGAPLQLAVVGLRAGDADADGDLDLAVTQTTVDASVVVENVGVAGPAFLTAGDHVQYPYTPQGVEPIATLLPNGEFVDLDLDGRADVVAAHALLQRLVVVTAEDAVGDGGNQISGGQTSLSSQTSLLDHAEYGHDLGTWLGPLRLYLDVPPAVPVQTFDHVQVQVWEQRPGESEIEEVGLENWLYALPEPSVADDPTKIALDVRFPDNAPSVWTTGRNIYLTYRFANVVYNPSPRIVGSGRWFTSSLTLTDDLTNWTNTAYQAALLANPYFSGFTDEIYELGAGDGINGIVLGITADVGRVGDFVNVPVPAPRMPAPPADIFYWGEPLGE